MALTKWFRKNFTDFLSFAFICNIFVAKRLIVPQQRSSCPLGVINEPKQFSQLLSNVCYEFEHISFQRISVNF